jgi:hypothetical protein
VVSFRPRCFGARLRTPRWVPADKLELKARSACDDGSIKASVRPSVDRSLYKIDHPAVGDWRGPLSESLEARLAIAGRHPFRRRLTEPAVTKPLIIRTLKEIASARSIFSYELDCIVVPIEQDDPGSVFHLTLLCGVSSHRPQMSVVNVRSTGIAAGWRVSGTGTSRPQPVRRPNTIKGIVLYSPSCTDCARKASMRA